MNKILLTLLSLLLLSSMLFGKRLVTVNGHPISDEIIPKGYEKLDDSKKASLMEHLIKEELIHSYLLKQDLVKDPKFQEVFEKQKALAQKQYKKVSGKSLTKEQIRNIKGSIALMLYQQNQLKKTTITQQEVRDFYNNNQEKFNFPDSIEIANIITKTKDEAKQLIKKLKKSKNLDQEFLQAAKEHKQNGYMGWFGRGMAPKNLFDAAYKAKVRTIIPHPIKTKHGYHVVYLLNKKTAGKVSFEEAKANIEQLLKQQKVIEKLENKINTLYGNAEIVY
jgi:parvulin-like peptidyl-prolyl isomerase